MRETIPVSTSSGKTHNASCRYYANSKGHDSSKGTGNNCNICGGADCPTGEKCKPSDNGKEAGRGVSNPAQHESSLRSGGGAYGRRFSLFLIRKS